MDSGDSTATGLHRAVEIGPRTTGIGTAAALDRPLATAPSASDRAELEQGRRAFERGDDESALRHFGRIIGSGLRFADVHYRLGLIHDRRGDLAAASASLKEAIRINPGYVEALLALATVAERLGHFDQARSLAERAEQLSRPAAGGLDATTRGKLSNQQAALADALAAAGLRREAIEQYRLALERCPTFADIRHRLASTLRETGLPFQAEQEFLRILDARPELSESRIQLGLTYHMMGRSDEAIAAWREVLAREPARREAIMYLRLVGAEGAGEAAEAGWTTRPLVAEAARADAGSASGADDETDDPLADLAADPDIGASLE